MVLNKGLVYRSQLKDERKTKVSTVSLPFRLIGYGNSSYAGDPEDRKSVRSYCYFINGAIIS